jgi:prolipoprotein diacylglyceryltransferase
MSWGLVFTDPRCRVKDAWLGLPLHPTQVYEIILLVTIAVVLQIYYQRNRVPGMVMVGYGYLYSLERFAIEFIRGESETERYLFGTTLAQTTSLGIVAVAACYHLHLARRVPPGPLPEETVPPSEPDARPES